MGCQHYRRNCKLLAPCCNEYFWCRHCHNEEKNAPDQGARRHTLNRHSVTHLKCMACYEEQPVATHCRKCKLKFGAYSCLKCNLFDDDIDKKQFHCGRCGICRTGGAENFFHCDTCGCCYQQGLQENHHCVQNNMQNPCPICSEVLFDSVKEISTLDCGHAIHRKCLQQAVDGTIPVCLVCQRTAEDDSQAMDVVLKAFTTTQSLQVSSEDTNGHCKWCRSILRIRHVHNLQRYHTCDASIPQQQSGTNFPVVGTHLLVHGVQHAKGPSEFVHIGIKHLKTAQETKLCGRLCVCFYVQEGLCMP